MKKSLFELKEARNVLLDELEGLVEVSNPTDEQSERENAVQAELKQLNKQINVLEQKAVDYAPVKKAEISPLTALRSWAQGQMTAEERSILPATIGSANVPKEVSEQILTKIMEKSPMKQVAEVKVVPNTGTHVFPISTDSDTGEVVTVGSDATSGDTTYSSVSFTPYQYSSKRVRLPIGTILAAGFDVEKDLINQLANRVANIQNTHATTGDGTLKITGIETDVVTGTTETGVTAANLASLYFSVYSDYRTNGTWMMTDSALATVAGMSKDDQQKIGFLPLQDGKFSIYGKPVVVNNTATKVLFGDFSSYKWVETVDMMIKRSDSGDAFDSNSIDFILWSYVDAKYANPGDNPIKALELS